MPRRLAVIFILLILPMLFVLRPSTSQIQNPATPTASTLRAPPDISSAIGFILEWRTDRESPRFAYRISSPNGVKRVKAWANAHARQIETSASIPPMAAIPSHYFWVVETDGTLRAVPLVASYPADFTIPKGQRQDFIENLSDSDFESLQRIFIEFGTMVQSPNNP